MNLQKKKGRMILHSICRSEKQAQQLNRSVWKASSVISSNSSMMDSTHTAIMVNSHSVFFCSHHIYLQLITDIIAVLTSRVL